MTKIDQQPGSQPPELAEVYENYRRFVNPPLARVMRFAGSPVEWKAAGTRIWDHEGKSYLDFAGGYGVFTLGHCHPRVIAAVQDQLTRIALSGKTMFNAPLGQLARRLAEITPGALEISFFANSGTEAVEAALKLARAATGRQRIIATTNAYHGKTIGALSVSGRAVFKEPFGELLPNVVHIPFGETSALFDLLAGAAAVILEPIQAEGGVILPPAGYLQAVAAACRSAEVLLIIDEVQTGLGRCGRLFACELEGVEPDIMVLAKGLSGGIMPIGVCISTLPVWNAAYKHAPLLHSSTFGGSELACVAALAALEVLEEEGLILAAQERGSQLLAGVERLEDEYPGMIEAVRGAGLLVGLEVKHEGYAGMIISELLKGGVTAAWTLNQQRVIRLEPPLIISSSEVEFGLEALQTALYVTWNRLGRLDSSVAC